MEGILQRLTLLFQEAIKGAFGSDITPEVATSTQPQFGHYQCNEALKLAKQLKKNPREVASEIIKYIPNDSIIEKLEIAGPGFINITLKTSFLAEEVRALLKDERLGVPPLKKRERVVVEFSSPNIAKELHVGHLRSTIIGDAIARLFEFLGDDVLRLNHVGDWGTQFGMLITYLSDEEPAILSGEKKASLEELMNWYKASKKRFDADTEFKKRSQQSVVSLQGGDPAALKAWNIICDISRQAFEKIYGLLDVKIQERGESFYNPVLPDIVKDLEDKGLITVSDGAKCVFLDGYKTRDGAPLPVIVQKSDGGFNYDTTDIAAMRQRAQEEGADQIIIVTDGGQTLHFEMLDKVCIKAGYIHEGQFHHVPFGVVLGPDGKKFKTREGETEKLIDFIEEATSRASKIFKERLPDASDEEIQTLGTILGIDALKYADLSSHRVKDYTFSYERMLRFEGNTAPFLLYAYVRIEGIKRKVGKEPQDGPITLTDPSEIALALHLRQFGETLEQMAKDLLPNRLCEYLYNLAEKFNAFFRDCRVEGSEHENSRLLLSEATSKILAQGLTILGLKILPRM